MSDIELFPRYIQRPEERAIIAEARRVRADGRSRAVLLYGAGGTGKTRLVRELSEPSEPSEPDRGIVWLRPIDVDDSQQWLLSNLEQNVARQLDPDDVYFGAYRQYLSQLPRYAWRRTTSHETVLGHLTRIKAEFGRCYRSYIEATGATVVMTFDTVEAIRGMYALFTLTQWMKTLPATLFILAGRPPSDGRPDSIKTELDEPHSRIPASEIRIGEFSIQAAEEYFDRSGVAASLSDEEKEKLICLTRGHPLWLAFTVDYLDKMGVPAEAGKPVEYIRQNLPLGREATPLGYTLAEEFRRRLVAPYHEADFWHEAIRRLAVVRESISQPVWCGLMADMAWPADAPDPDTAWDVLKKTEWVRTRANRRYVTLHDAVAEELATRVIPLHDPDERWRQGLWREATKIYADLVEPMEAQAAEEWASVTGRLNEFYEAGSEGIARTEPVQEAGLIGDVTAVDRQRQEVSHLRSAQVFYQLLSGFAQGADQFLTLLARATREHNVLFEDLLAFQMQRFLPGGQDTSSLGDAVASTVAGVRAWLDGEGSEKYAEIGLAMAGFLIDREQFDAALALLDRLPVPSDHLRRYRLLWLRGSARMRMAGQVKQASEDFKMALAVVAESKSDDQHRLIAAGYNALGFYYRNIGMWRMADEAYRNARDAISTALSVESPESDREQMASIQTNWAYLKGIGGDYRDGINLAESAISVRRRLGGQLEVGMSLSVCGEVYRYRRSFAKAWAFYAEAEQVFQELNNFSWLGQIYQEQAICLFQAQQDGISLVPGQNQAELAEKLIVDSLSLCHELNVRAYPSALNRAGRIFGSRDVDAGLGYLLQAAAMARLLSDGWFWFASLIEYAELSYRAWSEMKVERYMDQISAIAAELTDVKAEYGFPELAGRWDVLRGHIGLEQALRSKDQHDLAAAFENYKHGFPLITHGYVGSYGESVIPDEIQRFGGLISRLPGETRARWLADLRRAWSDEGESATLLLARLEELY